MGDRVFVSYSRKDEAFVLKLATNLKNQGVPVWLDQWDIPTGANWDRTIEKALDESNYLLLILSPTSVNSDEVQCEWREALDDKKTVVPILYQPCEIPYRLNTIQYIDFTSRSPDDEEAIGQILNALAKARPTLGKIVKEPEETPDRHKQTRNTYIKIAIAILAILVIAAVLWVPRGPTSITTAHDWYDKGRALADQGKYDEAIKAYDEAIKLDPNQVAFWSSKGDALVKLKKYNEAIMAYDEAIRLDPNYAETWKEKGNALFNQQKYDEAIMAYDEAIRLAPTWATAWIQKGNALFPQKKYSEAIMAYDEAIRLDPNCARAWKNKGIALERLNKYDEADAALTKAEELGENTNNCSTWQP